MGWRDRFFTPTTASAIMSWRILVGIGVGVAMAVAGLPVGVAIGVGAAVYAGSVAAAMPRGRSTPTIDAFTLSEPWRQIVQAAQASSRKLREGRHAVSSSSPQVLALKFSLSEMRSTICEI